MVVSVTTLTFLELYANTMLIPAVMWGLFTRALTLASSTVRVSVINTSANFFLTATLGALIFTESLPGEYSLCTISRRQKLMEHY